MSKNTRVLAIRCSAELHDAMMRAAREYDRSMTKLGKIVLEEWLGRNNYLPNNKLPVKETEVCQ